MIRKVSIRRACEVLRAGRSTCHYVSRSLSQADLRQRIREIAETRVRYGYRRIHVLLRREGWEVNAKRVIACIARKTCNCGIVKRPRATGSSAALNAEAEGEGEASG